MKNKIRKKRPRVKRAAAADIRSSEQIKNSGTNNARDLFFAVLLTALLSGLSFMVIQLLIPKHPGSAQQIISLIPDLIVKLTPKAKIKARFTEKFPEKTKFTAARPDSGAKVFVPAPVTGEAKETLSGEKSEFTFELYNDEAISASTGLYSLRVCCPQGTMREYYTYPMEWDYILHKWSDTTPTVTLYQLDKTTRQAKMQVVILKNDAENTGIKQADILRFIRSVDEKLPGYNWEADIRVEQ